MGSVAGHCRGNAGLFLLTLTPDAGGKSFSFGERDVNRTAGLEDAGVASSKRNISAGFEVELNLLGHFECGRRRSL